MRPSSWIQENENDSIHADELTQTSLKVDVWTDFLLKNSRKLKLWENLDKLVKLTKKEEILSLWKMTKI